MSVRFRILTLSWKIFNPSCCISGTSTGSFKATISYTQTPKAQMSVCTKQYFQINTMLIWINLYGLTFLQRITEYLKSFRKFARLLNRVFIWYHISFTSRPCDYSGITAMKWVIYSKHLHILSFFCGEYGILFMLSYLISIINFCRKKITYFSMLYFSLLFVSSNLCFELHFWKKIKFTLSRNDALESSACQVKILFKSQWIE